MLKTEMNDIDNQILRKIYYIGHKCLIEVEKELESYGVTFPQVIMLHIVCANKDKDICQKDIADVIGTKASSISSIINNLCKKNLLERKIFAADARKYAIKATKEGLELNAKLSEKSKNSKLNVFENVTEAEKEQLLKILLKMV